MSTYEPDSDSLTPDIGQRQNTIMTQLMKAAPTMYSIDELFQWLAYAIVHHFSLQIAQFWAPYINANGMQSLNLRTMVAKDPSLPEQVILNNQVYSVARRFAHEQHTIASQPVEVLFPAYHAAVLKRYSLNFCAASFIKSNVLLPSANTAIAQAKEATPFSLTILLFLMHHTHRDLMPTISAILQQAVGLAINRGLLLPIAAPAAFSVTAPRQRSIPLFSELIPSRNEGSGLMVASNPFARTAFIENKQALRLHTAIDGRKSVSELSRSTGMDMETISSALRMLLKQHRIELHDAKGQLVDAELILREID